jgi:hypothetical protein
LGAWWTLRSEGQRTIVVSKTAEATGKDHPGATHGGYMTTILNIAAHVGKVHQQSRTRVIHTLIELTDFQGDNGFCYNRSTDVGAYVLARAAGACEACKKPASFVRTDGTPYLEPHHTHRASDGGPDDRQWVAGICPNFHKHIDHGNDGPPLNLRLQEFLRAVEVKP